MTSAKAFLRPSDVTRRPLMSRTSADVTSTGSLMSRTSADDVTSTGSKNNRQQAEGGRFAYLYGLPVENGGSGEGRGLKLLVNKQWASNLRSCGPSLVALLLWLRLLHPVACFLSTGGMPSNSMGVLEGNKSMGKTADCFAVV